MKGPAPMDLRASSVSRLAEERLADWSTVRNVLAVRLDALGDVLMTTPALRAIRQSLPQAALTLLTSPAGAAVARHVPEIDRAIVRSVPWMKATADADPRDELAWLDQLRAEQFDAAVVFTVHSQSALPAALELWLAGIPLRLAHARENPYQLLTDWVPDPETSTPTRHEVRRQLDLVAAVGLTTEDVGLSFRVPPDDARDMRTRLGRHGLRPGGRWLVLHPGASAPSRRYPVESFLTAARRLVDEDGFRIVLTGSHDEAQLAASIARPLGERVIRLDGRLTLGQLGALLAMAPLLVANNTGPVHLAAAVGTPVVDLYALTNLQHTPWQVPARVLSHDVPCAGCRKSICPLGHHACLRGVEPDEVVDAVRELAGIRPSGPARADVTDAGVAGAVTR
jgi:lipopolysaccharide heptosyltransferase II